MNMDNYKEQNIPWEGLFVNLNALQLTKMNRCITAWLGFVLLMKELDFVSDNFAPIRLYPS